MQKKKEPKNSVSRRMANARWDAKNSKSYGFKCFYKSDQDIIDRLDQQENKNSYIKQLIRQDIANNPD